MSNKFQVGDSAYIISVYGEEKLMGEVLKITDEEVKLSFEDGYHVEYYPIEHVHKIQL